MNTPFHREFGLLKSWVMDHVICFVKTVPSQSLVKLNVFNYFEKKPGQSYTKQRAVEPNNEIILHFPIHPCHRRCFLSPNRNIQPN
jgi:hypothetical protein